MKQAFKLAALASGVAAVLAAGQAVADIEYREDIAASGQGIGAKATILTVQQSGNANTQSGCVAWNGSADVIGASGCPGGFTGGDEGTGASQTRTRALSEAGITSFSELAIVLDVNQTGNQTSVSLDNMVVRIWPANSSAPCHTAPLASGSAGDYSGVGTGTAGNVFALTTAQVTAATTTCTGTFETHRVGVAVDMSNANNGPETLSLARIIGGGEEPAIDIEKSTNGVDADEPTGPEILVGDAVTWAYVVRNIGGVGLNNVEVTDNVLLGPICTIATLGVGDEFTCTVGGTAVEGQYANIGTATGTPEDETNGTTVTDSDPSHYFGVMLPPPPSAQPIPVVGPLGLAALAAGLGGIGLLGFRRRK